MTSAKSTEATPATPSGQAPAPETFRHALDRHGPRLCRLAYFICADTSRAEHVVADAFARSWPRWSRGRVDDLATSLQELVVHGAIGASRWDKVRPVPFARGTSGSTATPARPPSPMPQRLLGIPAGQRAVLVLRHLEGLDDERIGSLLHIPVSTVTTRASRGMAALGKAAGLADTDIEAPLAEQIRFAAAHSPGMAPGRARVATLVRRHHRSRVLLSLAAVALLAAAVALPIGFLGSSAPEHRPVVQLASPTTSKGSATHSGQSATPASTSIGPGSPSSVDLGSTTTAPNLAPVVTRALPPASGPPVVAECTSALKETRDGNFSPLYCPNGGINVLAWQAYAKLNPSVMALGPSTTALQVTQAMCADLASSVHATVAEEVAMEQLAARYYGWHLTLAPFTSATCAAAGSSQSAASG